MVIPKSWRSFSTSKNLVAFMYILDNILYNFDVSIRTYFQKVADPADIASSMSVGFTINHIAAVVLPALGGYFWMMDYRIPFIAGKYSGCGLAARGTVDESSGKT